MAKLTTTSYAILGLLKRRPWTAYELTKYMQRSGIRAVWPRTESRIYVEFKNLVGHELATATKETKQGRKRTLYTITKAGDKSFQQWMASTEGGLRLESEPLLKLLYADLDTDAIAIQLEHMNQQLLDEARVMHEALTTALENGFFFDENAIHNAQQVKLLTTMLETRADWLRDMKLNAAKIASKGRKQGLEEAQKIYQQETTRLEKLIRSLDA